LLGNSSTRRRVTTVVAAIAIGLAGAGWSGCGDDSGEDQANQAVDEAQQAIDDAQDSAENVPDEAQDAIDDAQQQAEDAIDDATK
jgi:hypothetical protein